MKSSCIHKIFERQVLSTPEKIALVCADRTLTYRELNIEANRVAHKLLILGVELETCIAISLPRSIELIVNILGILKAGCAYLPLDPSYPLERLSGMVEVAKVPILITETSFLDRLPNKGLEVICTDLPEPSAAQSENPDLDISPKSLAYVMFTSGSTGRPKGVMVEHRSVARLVQDTDYVDFSEDTTFLHFAPISFDASTFEIWGALLNGGRLAIVPDGATSLADLGCAIREYGVTTLWLTAGLFHVMVDEHLDALRPLRQLVAGGDILSVDHVSRVLLELDCDLVNGYGPTENTTFTCTYKVSGNADIEKSVPIGRPIRNTQVYILDDHGAAVHEGEEGELYIGGEGLARGYLGDDRLTREKFVTISIGDSPAERLYRSGDLVRRRVDGNIEFLGRVDNQVKVRGFRIELEEIENALRREPGVRGAAVVVRETRACDKQLVAFVVLDEQAGQEICALRANVEAALPGHMVPSYIFSVDALPITTNGKVDRAALVGRIETVSTCSAPPASSRTTTEASIANMLEEILGTCPIGLSDNFFDIGASSLQLALFHSRLQQSFDQSLRIVALFQNPSIKSLAGFLDKVDTASVRSGTSGLQGRSLRQRNAYAKQRSAFGRSN